MHEERTTPRFKAIDRRQLMLRTVDVESLIEEDHPARAIWAFTGRMNWNRFYADVKAVEGGVGRSAWDPRLLGSLWIYAYSRGIGSAREVARRCAYDPAFQWLTGLQEVNYHTLANFRVAYKEALDELFVQALGLLSAEGLITMERVVHDGTKIRAFAGQDSYRREERVQAFLEAARKQVEAMGDPTADPSAREKAARMRARRDREARLEQAITELAVQQANGKSADEARASISDPQARIMKQSNGGFFSSYNVQISTDTAQGMIVGVGVSQSSNDVLELVPAMDRLEQTMGRKPQQVVADGGFTNRQTVNEMEQRNIDFIGSVAKSNPLGGTKKSHGIEDAFAASSFIFEPEQKQYRCPAGHILRHKKKRPHSGSIEHTYLATACGECPFKPRCCPKTKGCRSLTQIEDTGAWKSFLLKMETDAAKAAYKIRGWMAEFPNAWIKEKMGLRQFHVRGLEKVGLESKWACLTYNIQQWIRLRWKDQSCAA